MKQYYVYKITHLENEYFYFGHRGCSTKKQPLDDIGVSYFSSGILHHEFKNQPSKFKIDILGVYKDSRLAEEMKSLLVKMHINNYLCKNLSYNSAAYTRAIRPSMGKKHTKDKVKKHAAKVDAKKKADAALKQTLETYYDESLGCMVTVYPTSIKKNARK